MNKNRYVVVKKDETPFSQVVNDCDTGLCVPAVKGENLNSILKKLCALIVKKTAPVVTVKNDRLFNRDLAGARDGFNAIFNTSLAYQLTSTAVYYNGQRMKLDFDYFETGDTEITFAFPIYPTDVLIIDYNKKQ